MTNPLSEKYLITTCRMAYQHFLDEAPLVAGPRRLTKAQERDLGRRLAVIWAASCRSRTNNPDTKC